MAYVLTVVLLAVLTLDPVNRALDRGDFANAWKLSNQYAAARPRSASAQVAKARAAIGLGDNKGALRALQAALEFDPANADALYYAAKVSYTLAQQQYQAFEKLAGDSPRGRMRVAEVLSNPDEKRRQYEEALLKDIRFVPAIAALGDLDRLAGNCASAVKHYGRALDVDPANAEAMYGIGMCHVALGDAARGRDELRRAAAMDPALVEKAKE